MKILNEKPPEWIMTGCLNQFRIDASRTFWTYGDTIYNPGAIDIRPDIEAHEEQHCTQQTAYEGGKDAWWREYLANPRFRLEQEAEAYGAQYKFFCKRFKDRNQRSRFLDGIVGSFAGPLYQLAITKSQARAMILVLSGEKKLNDVA